MDCLTLKSEYVKKFEAAGIAESSDIDWAMVEVLNVSRGRLAVFGEIDKDKEKEIRRILNARLKHIPLAYILKKAYFFGREFLVNRYCLIPRMDTEVLAEQAIIAIRELQKQKESVSVLDLCTGSGILAITVALETNAVCTAVDISHRAVKLARRNAKRLGAKVKILQSDMFSELSNLKFDIVISNPPYIRSGDIDKLQTEVSKFEPKIALDGGDDGLYFYNVISRDVMSHLEADGQILLEIGFDQADDVKNILSQNFEDIKVVKDLSGNDRVIKAKMCVRGFYD